MQWLSAVLGDFHFWIGIAAGLAGALLLFWENRRLTAFRRAREKDARLREFMGY